MKTTFKAFIILLNLMACGMEKTDQALADKITSTELSKSKTPDSKSDTAQLPAVSAPVALEVSTPAGVTPIAEALAVDAPSVLEVALEAPIVEENIPEVTDEEIPVVVPQKVVQVYPMRSTVCRYHFWQYSEIIITENHDYSRQIVVTTSFTSGNQPTNWYRDEYVSTWSPTNSDTMFVSHANASYVARVNGQFPNELNASAYDTEVTLPSAFGSTASLVRGFVSANPSTAKDMPLDSRTHYTCTVTNYALPEGVEIGGHYEI